MGAVLIMKTVIIYIIVLDCLSNGLRSNTERNALSSRELLNGDLSAKPVGNSIDDDPDLLYGEKFEDAPENTLDALKMAAEPIDSTDASEPNDEDMELLKNLMLSPYIYDMYFMLGLEKVPVYETLHSFHVNEIEKLRITDNRILSSQGGIYAEKITLSEQPIEIHMGTRVGSLFHHPNQDRVATYPCVDEDGFFVGLFDGHGRGAEDLVVPSIDWLGNTTTDKCRDDLGNLLIQLDKLIWKNADQLGSTGTLVLVKPAENRVVVQSANWGDSEAGILSVDSNGRHVLEMLTVSDNVVEKVSRIRVFERLLLDGFTAYVINPQDNKIKEIHTTKEFIDFDTKPNTFKFMKSKTAATKPLAATKPEDDFPVVVELLENYWGVEHTNGMLQSRQSLGDKSLMQVTPYWLDTPNKGALDLLRQPDTTSYVIVGSDGFWGALANGIKYEGKIVNEGIVAPSMDQYLSSLLGQESPHLFMRFNASLELPWQDRFLSNVMLLCRSQTDDCTYHITKIPNYSLEFPSSDQENN